MKKFPRKISYFIKTVKQSQTIFETTHIIMPNIYTLLFTKVLYKELKPKYTSPVYIPTMTVKWFDDNTSLVYQYNL